MSGPLTLILESTTNAGKEAEFQTLMEGLMPSVAAEDGTIDYRGFANETGGVMVETYASSEALLAHMANPPIAAVLQRLPELITVTRLAVLGEPTDAVRAAFESWNAQYYATAGGVSKVVPMTV